MNRTLIPAIATAIFGMHAAFADVPSLINYQGRLTDAAGTPVTGAKNFAISIYDAATSGNTLYTETIGAVTLDANGVYSFQFGGAGTSNTLTSEAIATTDGTLTTFQKVLANSPVVAGSVSVTDGTYTWSQSAGSSNEDDFGVAYSTSLRRVTVTYYAGAPAAGRTITATYRYGTSGIAGAISSGSEHWMAVSVDGTVQGTRQRVLAVPFAMLSNNSNHSISSERSLFSNSAESATGPLLTEISNLNKDIALLSAGLKSPSIHNEKFTSPSGLYSSVVTNETNLFYRNSFYCSVRELYSTSGLSVTEYTVIPETGLVRGVTIGFTRMGGISMSHWVKFDYTDGTNSFIDGNSFEGNLQYVGNPNPTKLVTSISMGNTSSSGRYSVTLLENSGGVIKINIPVEIQQQGRLGLFLDMTRVGSGDLVNAIIEGDSGNLEAVIDGYKQIPATLGQVRKIAISITSSNQSLQDYTKLRAVVVRFTE